MRNFLATSAKNELQLSFLLEKKKIAWDSISTLGMARWASGWVARATLGILRDKGPHRDSELQEAGIQVSEQLMRTHDRPSSQFCSCRRQNPLLPAWLLHQFYTYRKSTPDKTTHTASTCYRYYRSVFKLHIYQGCNVTLKTHRKHMSLNSQTNHVPFPSLPCGQGSGSAH